MATGMIGRTVHNYLVVEKLGEGGMGSVYRAVDQMVERNVALKVLRPEIAQQPEVLERFKSEAIALAKLNHHAVAQLYAFFKEGEEYFMAMEFVPGETLAQLLRRGGSMPWEDAVRIMVRVLEGVGYSHKLGVLHRDLKPANILITPEGEPKVTDFGIARIADTAGLTREARVVGTLEYLAPERALGKQADARSDIYSLGIVLYEMVTGALPFRATSDYSLMKAQVEELPPRPHLMGVQLPESFEEVLYRALAKNPDERYTTCAEFANDLRNLLTDSSRPSTTSYSSRMATVVAPTYTVPGTQDAPQQQPLPPSTPAPSGATGPYTMETGATAWVPPAPPKPPAAPPAAPPVAPVTGTAAKGAAVAPPILTPKRKNKFVVLIAVAAAMMLLSVVSLVGYAAWKYNELKKAGETQASTAVEIPPNAPEQPATNENPAPPTEAAQEPAPAPVVPPPSSPVSTAPAAGTKPATPGTKPAATPAGAKPPATQPTTVTPSAGPTQPPPPPKPAPSKPVVPAGVASIREVKTLFVEHMEDKLDDAVRGEMNKRLKARVTLAPSPVDADGVLRLIIQEADKPGTGPRLRRTATVQVLEPRSGRILWSDEVDEKGGLFRSRLSATASRIVGRLGDALR